MLGLRPTPLKPETAAGGLKRVSYNRRPSAQGSDRSSGGWGGADRHCAVVQCKPQHDQSTELTEGSLTPSTRKWLRPTDVDPTQPIRQVHVGFRGWNSSSTDCFGSLIRERSLRSFFVLRASAGNGNAAIWSHTLIGRAWSYRSPFGRCASFDHQRKAVRLISCLRATLRPKGDLGEIC